MRAYAQTNIQLFNQLRREGYSNTDLSLVRDAYELAMELSTGRFQPSGRPLIAHIVGTASILASLRLSAQVVAAGLLHNVYLNGDFGTGRPGLSAAKRKRLRRIVGAEVEEYVARFPSLDWTPRTIQLAHGKLDEIALVDRAVLLILLADYLEHLLDLDVLYYPAESRRIFANVGSIAVAIAEKLSPAALVGELKQRLREMELAEPPVDLPLHKIRKASFVIAPKSCRKRIRVVLCQTMIRGVHSLHLEIRKVLKLLYVESRKLVNHLFERNGAT